MNITIDYKTHKVYLLISIFIYVSFGTILSLTFPLSQLILAPNKSIRLVITFCFAYIHIFMSFYTFQFIIASSSIRLRFQLLNARFKSETSWGNVKIVAPKNFDLVEASNYFHHLCDGIETFNQTFTFHTVCIFMQLMVS